MTKKLLLILIIFLLFTPVLRANADVIIEPDNPFYRRYSDQCVDLGRYFCISDEYDLVSVQKAPNLNAKIGVIESGEIVYIKYSCLFKGEYWGLVSLDTGDKYIDGWVKTDQLLVMYDYIEFEEDHPGEFYQYNGEYDELKKEGAAVVWPWPGADAPLWTIENLNAESFHVMYAYTDEQGREWGFVTYLYGQRNIWVCLSDPLNLDIPAFNAAKKPRVWESETLHIDISQPGYTPKNESSMLLVIIILVAALVANTVVLIKMFWKPTKAKRGREIDD
ncbi:MAG: hypothetical protein FWH57_03125 [Oscillospiraceae bacterium]|nr:hypothetical protein [Oscillospiraceae bacterium]